MCPRYLKTTQPVWSWRSSEWSSVCGTPQVTDRLFSGYDVALMAFCCHPAPRWGDAPWVERASVAVGWNEKIRLGDFGVMRVIKDTAKLTLEGSRWTAEVKSATIWHRCPSSAMSLCPYSTGNWAEMSRLFRLVWFLTSEHHMFI